MKTDFEYVIDCLEKGLIKDSYVMNRIEFEEVPAFSKSGNFRTNKTIISL